jgi:tRNA (guanine37-N1)-methyltransferase
MRFDVFTLFPEYFTGPLSTSILKRARESGTLQVQTHDIREWTTDKHRMTDDYPFGGGAGMVMKAEPVARALEDVLNFEVGVSAPPCPVVFLTPQGRTLNQKIVEDLAALPHLALLCGHYEGIDERVIETCVTHEISLGDFVLTGGEGAAAILIEAVARFVPGVLGNEASASGDSFANGLLEAPHYTRPAQWRGMSIPEVLLSGHHGKIGEWRFWESVRRTLKRRPELVEEALRERPLSRRETKIYEEIRREVLENTSTEAKADNAERWQPSALENVSEEEAS